MQSIRKLEAWLVRLETAVLVALVAVMVLLSFCQVVLRLFGTGLLWADTLTRHLVLWAGFLGAALAAADNKHFAFEAFAHRKGRLGTALKVFGNLFGAAMSALLAQAAWQFFQDERASGEALFSIGTFSVPSSWFAAAIPVGFVLVLIHLCIRAALAGESEGRAA